MNVNDRSELGDSIEVTAGYERKVSERLGIRGHGVVELWTPIRNGLVGTIGRLVLVQRVEFENLITEVGDEYYGERAAGIASPPGQVTGMRLGTGSTTPAKTGAGAAIVTYVSGSALAIDGSFPTSALSGSSRRIQWKTTWGAGVATANGIAEAVITNESPLTDVTGSAANTISRALVSPTVNKGASDTLAITWNHDLLGA